MSGLTWRGESAETLSLRFIRESQLTSKRALRHMRRVSKSVLKTAIEWSPLDWKGPGGVPGHELEKAHHLNEEYGSGRRLEAVIEVGGMVGNVDVDLYAMWQHDGIMWSQRGPATKAKGPKAGPRWLERAMEEHQDDFEPLLDDLLEGLMR